MLIYTGLSGSGWWSFEVGFGVWMVEVVLWILFLLVGLTCYAWPWGSVMERSRLLHRQKQLDEPNRTPAFVFEAFFMS